MAVELEDVDNPSLDVDAVPNDGSANTDPAATQDQAPFLEVNDRTKFLTKEDAVKSFDEAGRTIANLRNWEKELEVFGVKDPRIAAELLRELQGYRRDAQKQSATVTQPTNARAAEPSVKLSEEEQKARGWLKAALGDPELREQLGFASKKEVEEKLAEIAQLKEQLGTLSSGRAAEDEVRTQSLIEDGEAKIGSWLKEAGIDGGDEKMKFVATNVKVFIEADPARVDRFFRGGTSTERVVREGYDWAMKQLGWKTAPAGTTNAQSKGKQLAANKTLPTGGTTANVTKDGKPKQQSGKPDLIGNVANKAWDEFQKSLGN